MNNGITAYEIKDGFEKHGVTSLLDAAARGIHTLPESIADHYAQLQAVLDENADRFGNIPDWRPAKEAADLVQKIYSSVAFSLADDIIRDHLKPALASYLERFRADVQTTGSYAVSTDVGALLSQPDEIREAHIRLLDSHQDYAALRSSWLICRKRNAGDYNGTGTIDPDGLGSPLAEVANLPDLVADWQLAFHGRKPWPWTSTAHHVRLGWLLANGAEIWLPTGQEQDQAWAKYNPGRRVAA